MIRAGNLFATPQVAAGMVPDGSPDAGTNGWPGGEQDGGTDGEAGGRADDAPGELFTTLLAHPDFALERIVSTGQASPPDFWYDQPRDEWVVLLRGAARLAVAGETEPRTLAPGDWVVLPAHCRHRVAWTDPTQPTVWLALHYDPAPATASEPGSTSPPDDNGAPRV